MSSIAEAVQPTLTSVVDRRPASWSHRPRHRRQRSVVRQRSRLGSSFVEPHSAGDGYAVVMTRPGTGLFLGLDHHSDADREAFDARRTGLDHIALGVASREDMDTWVSRLDAKGVDHGPLLETTEPLPHAMVVLRDPDGIAIELFWFGG